MAVVYNTNIVKDGLSLLLDPANIKSYPGSGSLWVDLENKIQFVANGTPATTYSLVGGAPAFTFNGTGYWESTSNHNLVDLGGDCTVILWIYGADVTTRKTFFEKAGTTYQSYRQELAMTLETNEAFSYYSRNFPGYDSGSTATIDINKWSMTGIRISTGKTSNARVGYYSKNGAAWVGSYTSNSNTALVAAGAIRIGTGYAGTMDNCSVGAVLCYNRMLSDAEIKQNFESYRGRYGL